MPEPLQTLSWPVSGHWIDVQQVVSLLTTCVQRVDRSDPLMSSPRPFSGFSSALRCARVALALSMRSMLLMVVSFGGCGPAREANILQVRDLSGVELDRGDSLRIDCAGIATGQDVTVSLVGELHTPDTSAEHTDLELPGKAISDHEVLISDLAPLWKLSGPRATFVGRVRVEAALRFADSRATGEASALLELRSTADGALGVEAMRSRRAEQRLRQLGLTAGTLQERGLPVLQVWAASIGERAGVLQGDTIVAVNGVTVVSMADLGGTAFNALRVMRAGEVRELSVSSSAGQGGWAVVLFAGLLGSIVILRANGGRLVRSYSRGADLLAFCAAFGVTSLSTATLLGQTLRTIASPLPAVLLAWGCVLMLLVQLGGRLRRRLSGRGLCLASFLATGLLVGIEGLDAFGSLSMTQVGVVVAVWVAALLSGTRGFSRSAQPNIEAAEQSSNSDALLIA